MNSLRGVIPVVALCLLFVVPASKSAPLEASADCPPVIWMDERLDYYSPGDQIRVRQIESNHFDADTEALVRGRTGSTPGYDIEFLVRYVPNHPRGLAALVRLALRDKATKPSGVSQPVECYLLRALEFRPADAEVLKVYGTYLARLMRSKEALKILQLAETHAPTDLITAYNIGLVLVDLRDYEQARKYASKAYSGGISFPGLRDKLAKVGQWSNK